MPGKGVVLRTGSLGDVMKESVEAARTVVRSRAQKWGIANTAFEKRDLHVHFPEGATPKDGPSAGLAITPAMVAALTGIQVRADLAMTGGRIEKARWGARRGRTVEDTGGGRQL